MLGGKAKKQLFSLPVCKNSRVPLIVPGPIGIHRRYLPFSDEKREEGWERGYEGSPGRRGGM